MLDFVESIAPFLQEGVLPALVTRCLTLEKIKRDGIREEIQKKPYDYKLTTPFQCLVVT